MTSFPNVDLQELKRQKKQNLRERLEFLDQYVAWLKKTPNRVWSKQLKALD
ncbi:hypothetical protein HY992_00560 [Candidatus Micrarchaeota archaeon]|nr:hypothetical protein [Candidatus Micrarchaeota archaeon]